MFRLGVQRWLSVVVGLGLPLLSLSDSCYKTGKTMFIRQVAPPVSHGEGPFWSAREEALYYVDISAGGVHRLKPDSGQHTSLTLNGSVGAIVQAQEDVKYFIIGLKTNLTLLTWDGKSKAYDLKTLDTVEKDKPGNRFNDGKADPNGNLWIGTIGEENPPGTVKPGEAALYRMDPTSYKLDKVLGNVTVSNGLAWSANGTIMFYIDSPTRKIDAFDYDPKSLAISNRRTFFDFAMNDVDGVPDGMTIDTRDHLWIACWGGSQVIEVSADGCLVRKIKLPVERVTSVTWGGKDLTTLYVTTMNLGLTPAQLAAQPQAGATFAIEGLNAQGQRPSDPVSLKCLKYITTSGS